MSPIRTAVDRRLQSVHGGSYFVLMHPRPPSSNVKTVRIASTKHCDPKCASLLHTMGRAKASTVCTVSGSLADALPTCLECVPRAGLNRYMPIRTDHLSADQLTELKAGGPLFVVVLAPWRWFKQHAEWLKSHMPLSKDPRKLFREGGIRLEDLACMLTRRPIGSIPSPLTAAALVRAALQLEGTDT